MNPLYKILSISVISVICASKMFAQSDSILCEMPDTTYNNTIKDTIVLEYSKGYVRFETIRREGDKYFAVTSDNKDVEITSMINGKTRVLVKYGDGHELVIDKDGNVMGVEEYKKCGGSSKLLSEHNAHRDSTMATSGNVKFSKVKDENYGFDEWRGNDYDKDVYDNFNGYRPTYIGVQKQSNIKVAASQTKGVRFITERGVPIIANTADNTLNLTIGTAGKQTVYAYSDSTLVGKLCIQAYDTKEVKVHVVRVNNGKQLELNKIADEVNRIYSSAVVHYTFDELEPITIEYANKQHFVHGGKGTFQNYNADQKAAIKALPETADPNDYYLFFTDCYNRLDTAGNTSKEAVNGYMPVGRHYGFIYNEYTNARTIAHELGHGTNSLHHTFSQESESFYTTEKTDNLMDYNGGIHLNHRQWQWSHEKHRNVLGFLDDEGESESNILPFIYWLGHNNIGGKYLSDELEDKIDDCLDMLKVGDNKRSVWINGEDNTIDKAHAEWSVEQSDIVPQIWLSIKSNELTDAKLKGNRVYSWAGSVITSTKEPFHFNSNEDARFRYVNLFSFVENAKLSNYKIKELSDLENNKRVKVGYYDFGDKFIVIAFFSEDGSLDLVLQVIANEIDNDLASLTEDWVRSLLITTNDHCEDKEQIDPIQYALSVIFNYEGKTYHQDSGTLRTDTTEAALEQMDCSELVCRFLQLACGLDNVPNLTTADFADIAKIGCNEYLQYVVGSKQDTHTDIKPGDIFLWRTESGGGHVGIVKDYSNDVVTIMEAISSSGSREESKYNSGACKGCIRESKYSRLGNALVNHDGWKGYFRPIVKL